MKLSKPTAVFAFEVKPSNSVVILCDTSAIYNLCKLDADSIYMFLMICRVIIVFTIKVLCKLRTEYIECHNAVYILQ